MPKVNHKSFVYLGRLLSVLFVLLHPSLGAIASESPLRDPTTPFIEPILEVTSVKPAPLKAPVKKYVLQATFISFDKKIAVIDEKEYQEGEKVGRYRIDHINHDNVIMSANEQQKVLHLYVVNNKGVRIK